MTNVTILYLNVVVQVFLSFPSNVIQEELTYSLGQVIMKPNIMQNYSSGYSHIFVFGYHTKRQHIPHQKVACISHIQPAIKLFIAPILICYCRSQGYQTQTSLSNESMVFLKSKRVARANIFQYDVHMCVCPHHVLEMR